MHQPDGGFYDDLGRRRDELRLKGHVGLDHVLSVQVPTYFWLFEAETQYRLLEHMLPGAQHELTFAFGLQGKSPASSSATA